MKNNLNLLQYLPLLVSELNVTEAAKKAEISQSAMSQALAKLRITLSDPILVKSGSGLKSTPKAEYLEQKLKKYFDDIDDLLHKPK
jgi:DNA-binding transcriptional LysR family regulator